MKVSVVIPTYNRYDTLPRAIDSVLSQTHKDWELLVIDDGSTDTTPTLFEGGGKYASNEQIRYVPLSNNQGVHVARNTGIEAATGDFIVLLDSDDELYASAFEVALQVVEIDSTTEFITGPFETETGEKTGLKKLGSSAVLYAEILCEKSHYPHKNGFVMIETGLAKSAQYAAPNLDFVFFRHVVKNAKKIWYADHIMGMYNTNTGGATLTASRRIPNIPRSIKRAYALENFVFEYEKDFEKECYTNLAPYAYGAAVGLLLDSKKKRALIMVVKAVRSNHRIRDIMFLVFLLIPFSPFLLRSLFNIKLLVSKQK